LYRVEEAIVIQ